MTTLNLSHNKENRSSEQLFILKFSLRKYNYFKENNQKYEWLNNIKRKKN